MLALISDNATMMFQYLYIVNGAELMMLIRDFIKYVCGGKQSMRLARTIHMWQCLLGLDKETDDRDDYWLQKAIIRTPTWFDSPKKYRRMLRAVQKKIMQSNDNEYDNDDLSQISNL